MKKYNVQPATGTNTMSQLANLTFEKFIEQIKLAYINFFHLYIGNNVVLGTMAKYSTILLILIAMLATIHYIRMKRVPIYNYVIVALIVVCYPLVALMMSIAMEKDNIDYLTSFGISLLHPTLLLIIFGVYKEKNKWTKALAVILSLAVLFANISFSNGAYVTSKVMYDRTLSVMTRILEDIDETEGYVIDETEVVVIGVEAPDNINAITEKYDSMRAFNEISISYAQTFRSFANLLGYDLKYQTDLSDVDSTVVEDMPCYPNEGYCQMVDGKMIVKFGD